MRSKILTAFLLTLVLSLATLAMVSAADFSLSASSISLSKSINSTGFIITNNAGSAITVNVPEFSDISDGDGHTILIDQSASGNIVIPAGDSETIEVSYASFLPASVDPEDLALGTFSESITVSDGVDNSTVTLKFISGFCEQGERRAEIDEGERYLEIVSVKDESSEDDWEWKPLDEVEIEVKIKFNSDDSDDDIDGIIKIGLYDTDNNEFIDLDHDEDTEIDFGLDEGDKLTETFKIIVPVEDVEDSTNRYKLYVKAYEEDEEETLCTDLIDDELFQDIEIKKEKHDVSIDELSVTTPVPCGEEVEVSLRAYNIGTKDQDDVQVTFYNTELGLELNSDVFSLDEGDSERLSFSFIVPEDTREDTYTLKLYASFDYSSSSDSFDEKSKDFSIQLKVEGNCREPTPTPDGDRVGSRISAELDSETPEAIAGEQVIVIATIENTGEVETTYSISVTGNSGWSDVISITPQIVTIEPGEEEDVVIILDIDDDAEGEQEFTIRTSYLGKTDQQRVALDVSGKSSAVQTDAFVNHLRENWFIYLIVIINIILIIAIIAVVRRMVRPQPGM